VPLDAITQAIALGSLNLTLILQTSKGDEWEGVALAHKDVSQIKMAKRVS
jgi:hypothetical protein